MEKMTKYLLEVAFIALMIRIIGFSAGLPEALALISLVSSITYKQWMDRNKVSNLEELNKRIDEITTVTQALKMDRMIRRPQNESQSQVGTLKRPF